MAEIKHMAEQALRGQSGAVQGLWIQVWDYGWLPGGGDIQWPWLGVTLPRPRSVVHVGIRYPRNAEEGEEERVS